MPQQDKTIPLPFPTRTLSARKPESNEELLRMFRKVEINIPLLDAIKQIPKYAKFLKELCVHKSKKIKGVVEIGGIEHNKHCQRSVETPEFSLSHAPLATVRLSMPYVLVQVNELIFLVDFYVLDLEDETSGKGATLILGRPFLMTARKRLMCMSGHSQWNLFNIFEAMKHPTEDHSLFGIDMIDELVEECFQLDTSRKDISNFVGDTKLFDCLGSIIDEADHDESREVHDLSNSKDDNTSLVDLSQEAELLKLLEHVCKHEDLEFKFSTRRNADSDSNPTRADSIPANRSRP
ncbi:hypothetical protein CR513_16805, partial [Mucuna pruriens]